MSDAPASSAAFAGRIGIAGTGRMGACIAKRLLDGGCAVSVWNRTPEKAQLLCAAGARLASNPRALAGECDVVISTVTDDAAARSVFAGANGLLAGPAGGRCFLEMSTLQPHTQRDLARLAEAAGACFVAAPVLGTTWHAANGQLIALAGGRIEDIERVRPMLAPLTKQVFLAGDAGAAAAMKLSVNLLLGVYLEGLAEALALGTREGLDVARMLEVLAASPLANQFLTVKMPVLAGGAAPTAFDLASMAKDLRSAIATASSGGAALPAATAALASVSAGVGAGWGGRDIAELPRFFRDTLTRQAAARQPKENGHG